jgi:hypothetical protein
MANANSTWELIMDILVPSGQSIQASYLGIPNGTMVLDPANVQDKSWAIQGNKFTGFYMSRIWSDGYPPAPTDTIVRGYGPAGAYGAPPNLQGPITLIGAVVQGATYDFDWNTGDMVQRT